MPPAADDYSPAFAPEAFFMGETSGKGVLTYRSGEVDQAFTVSSTGSRNQEGQFLLRQTITWSDGREEKRTFVLRSDGRGGLEGSFADEEARVTLTANGSVGHLRHGLPGVPMARMEQFLYLQPDGRTLINEGTVRVMGITVRRLHEIIERPTD
ncbi:MAG: DUF3833 family protein [Pseudomonadota bacterium]